MAKVKQTVIIRGKTKAKKTGKKRGNTNRCPVCGKFIKA